MLLKRFEQLLHAKRGAIHVGANVGEERIWYKANGFDTVLWFEPNYELFPILEENIKNYNNHVAFNVGIHDTLVKAKLNIANNSGQSSSILELGTHAQRHPDVKYIGQQKIKLTRLDSFFAHSGRKIEDYNFLNIDVQGVELNVIKSLGDDIEKLDYVYVEVNREELYVHCSLIQDIDIYMIEHGFERVATHWTNCNWGDAFYMKNNKHEFKPYLNTTFIETGSYVGDGIRGAVKAGFPKIISIEIADRFHEICKQRFENNKDVKLYHGDSSDLLPEIIDKIKHQCTFWLDAHYCGDDTGNAGVPLMKELEIIANHSIKTHTILIDDMRLIRNKEAEWKAFPYSITDIENIIKKINPKYEITYDRGTAENDILIAQVK